ncbi:hypothetical protein ACLKA6_013513 [Drosophila palustris]
MAAALPEAAEATTGAAVVAAAGALLLWATRVAFWTANAVIRSSYHTSGYSFLYAALHRRDLGQNNRSPSKDYVPCRLLRRRVTCPSGGRNGARCRSNSGRLTQFFTTGNSFGGNSFSGNSPSGNCPSGNSNNGGSGSHRRSSKVCSNNSCSSLGKLSRVLCRQQQRQMQRQQRRWRQTRGLRAASSARHRSPCACPRDHPR